MFKKKTLLVSIVTDFEKVSSLSNVLISASELEVEYLPAPHRRPSSLPKGKMATYAFFIDGRCLKVGKVGSKSQARFTSQHYNPRSSGSNLSASILKSKNELISELGQRYHVSISNLTEDTVGTWIEKNTSRSHFFMEADKGKLTLSLLEIYLQCRLRPFFEG